jgi:hypothetical protein
MFQMTLFKEIDDQTKYKLDCLVDRLAVESPMRPLKGFRLDFSTILASLGLMTTYTIVLLQFKIDEKK